ncbi:hypothetical protein D1872_218810 [compost metagenome]
MGNGFGRSKLHRLPDSGISLREVRYLNDDLVPSFYRIKVDGHGITAWLRTGTVGSNRSVTALEVPVDPHFVGGGDAFWIHGKRPMSGCQLIRQQKAEPISCITFVRKRDFALLIGSPSARNLNISGPKMITRL